jgi:hypothetical protein
MARPKIESVRVRFGQGQRQRFTPAGVAGVLAWGELERGAAHAGRDTRHG